VCVCLCVYGVFVCRCVVVCVGVVGRCVDVCLLVREFKKLGIEIDIMNIISSRHELIPPMKEIGHSDPSSPLLSVISMFFP